MIVAILSAIPATPASAAELYPIHLYVQLHVGEQLAIQVKTTYKYSALPCDAKTNARGAVEQFTAAFDGTETINAVDGKGRAVDTSTMVKTCTKDGRSILATGAVIEAKAGDTQVTLLVDGKPPANDVRHVLLTLISLPLSHQALPDDSMGTDQPRKVGESWPANCDVLAKSTRLPFPLVQDDLIGEGRLTDASTIDGIEWESIYLFNKCSFDHRKGSDGKLYDNLNMSFESTRKLPVDPSVNSSTCHWERKVTYTVSGRGSTVNVSKEWN